MHPLFLWSIAPLLLSGMPSAVLAQDDDIPFSACALLGAYYPPPTVSKSSSQHEILRSGLAETFDELIANGGSEDYGPISPNTTSFAAVLFTGSVSMKDEPVIFEYHYTSLEDLDSTETKITSNTRFPVGDMTMVFTVYAWLVKMGEQWNTPITQYLPELSQKEGSFMVPWKDVTIGSLANHMSGLSRQSEACAVRGNCSWEAFVDSFAEKRPLFLPDTTPVVSHAAFQLLAFAMERDQAGGDAQCSWFSILQKSVLDPLGMTSSGLLSDTTDIFAVDGLNTSQVGEPGALSLVSTLNDLALAGHSMLSSTLLPSATTRRWLHPGMDTSNLRNGVGRPWEVYRAGSATLPILDVLTKSGNIGQYASYFGLVPDLGAGFAILAHDSTVADRKLDLNVYADIVSEALGYFQKFAAQETAVRYAGEYENGDENFAAVNVTSRGPGLEVEQLTLGHVDVKAETATKLGIKLEDLDFRLYPTNVRDKSRHQFVAVFQDRSAPADMGTPTCNTWQDVGSVVGDVFDVVFEFNEDGQAARLELPGVSETLQRAG